MRSQPAPPSAPNARETWFIRAWLLSFMVLLPNFGALLGLGNINALERSFLLIAGLLFVQGKTWNKGVLVCTVLIALSLVVCGALTPFYGFEWGRMGSALMALLTFLVLFLAEPTPREQTCVLATLAWIPFVLLALSVLGALVGIAPLFQVDHTGATRLTGISNAAYFGACSSCAVMAASYRYLQHRLLRHLVQAVLALILCVLSGSRMFSVLALGSLVMLVLPQFGSARDRLLMIFYGGVSMAAFMATIGKDLVSRFASGSTSGREEVWATLLPWIDRYPYTGVGYAHHRIIIPESVGKYHTIQSHNEYLRLGVELGYPGAVVFLIALAALVTMSSLSSKRSFRTASGACIALVFLTAATENTFSTIYSMMAFVAISFGTMPVRQPQSATAHAAPTAHARAHFLQN